jgi:DNA-binding NarL/FixJ family response regulator
VVATDWAVALKESAFDLVVLVLREQAFSLALLARLRSRQPGLKVLAIGSGSEPEKILEAINAGAKGWLEDTASPAQVMQAAYAILAGSIWAPRQVLATLSIAPLTPRFRGAGGTTHGLRNAKKRCCSNWCSRAPIARSPRR